LKELPGLAGFGDKNKTRKGDFQIAPADWRPPLPDSADSIWIREPFPIVP